MIPVYEPDLSGNETKYVLDCMDANWISSKGKYVEMFEEAFADFCGAKYAIAVSNGTVALHLALVVLGVGQADEVIVPSLTFVATASAVRHAGASPIFVDSDPDTWTMDPERIEEKITPRTRAIIPVHLYGHPADMDPILALAEKHGLVVIEDAAEAHGAEYKGQKVGGIGDMGCFSFYGNKIITTGEGGMLTTNDRSLAERARFLKDHAMSRERRYFHTEIGFNYRMTNIQAAIGLAQVERADELIAIKLEIARAYGRRFAGCEFLGVSPQAAWAKSVYWMYSVVLEGDRAEERDRVMSELGKQGIGTRPFFVPIHLMPPYRQGNAGFPVAEGLSKRGLNLPSFPGLSQDDVDRVADSVLGLVGRSHQAEAD